MKDVNICGSMMRARIIFSCSELGGGGTTNNPTSSLNEADLCLFHRKEEKSRLFTNRYVAPAEAGAPVGEDHRAFHPLGSQPSLG
jgi:hypothetical protein